jgi:hypothetical protein
MQSQPSLIVPTHQFYQRSTKEQAPTRSLKCMRYHLLKMFLPVQWTVNSPPKCTFIDLAYIEF